MRRLIPLGRAAIKSLPGVELGWRKGEGTPYVLPFSHGAKKKFRGDVVFSRLVALLWA